jgi:hypothetical protein
VDGSALARTGRYFLTRRWLRCERSEPRKHPY